MAKECSFDIVSEYNKQELVNAIDQVKRELTTRFDLKDSNSQVDLDADKSVTITTNDEMKLKNIVDILQSKLVKRNLSLKILDAQTPENALGGNVRQVFNLKKGLTQELAKKIVSDIKATKLNVYWIVALTGGLSKHGPRVVFSGIVALAGLISCIMMGLAYALPAIPIWNSPWGTVQVLGAMLLGGTLLGGTILNMSVKETPLEGEADGRIRLLAMLGALVLVVGTAVLFGMGAGAKSAMINVAANTGTLIVPLILTIAFSIVAAVTAFLGRGAKRTAWLACGTIVALIAIFLARGIFYGVQIGIGL